MSSASQPADQSEIRLMGLILMQSLNIGIAVAIFDADIWIDLESVSLNAFTYAMGGFFVQGIAYYFFKMFFQQGMDERARMASQERERRNRYRSMEFTFDRRRQDMEMRMQEAQLETELKWMEENPGKTPPWIEARMYGNSMTTADFDSDTMSIGNYGNLHDNLYELILWSDPDVGNNNRTAIDADVETYYGIS